MPDPSDDRMGYTWTRSLETSAMASTYPRLKSENINAVSTLHFLNSIMNYQDARGWSLELHAGVNYCEHLGLLGPPLRPSSILGRGSGKDGGEERKGDTCCMRLEESWSYIHQRNRVDPG